MVTIGSTVQAPPLAKWRGKEGHPGPNRLSPAKLSEAPQEPRELGELTSEDIACLERWLCGKLGCACDAAEMVQRGLVKALEGKAQYDPDKGPLLVWLRRIVWSEAVDELRRQRRAPVSLSLFEDQDGNLRGRVAALASEAPGPEETYRQKQLRSRLARLLSALPRRERISVILCCLQQYSFERAARRLGLTRAQVRYAVEQGLASLRDMYSQER